LEELISLVNEEEETAANEGEQAAGVCKVTYTLPKP
jgi:hypothetical protein